MPLPIKFSNDVQAKLKERDEKLLKKLNTKKPKKLNTSNMIDAIEAIRQDVEKHLGHLKSQVKIIYSIEELEAYIEGANQYGYLAIDTETTGLNPLSDMIISINLYYPGHAAYVPINHRDYFSNERIDTQLTEEQVKPYLEKIIAKVLMHNAQFDIRVIKHTCKVRLTCYWDTQEAASLLNENESHRLKDLHPKYISHREEKTFSDYFGNGLFIYVPIEYAALYGINDSIDTFDLFEFQSKYLTDDTERQDYKDLYWVFRNIEMPMVDVIVDLEDNGVAVNMELQQQFYEKYHKKMDEALKECYAEIDKYKDKIDSYKMSHPNHKLENPINIESSTQLKVLFYDILKAKQLPDKGKSVDVDCMNEWSKTIPLAKAIIDYRKAVKITSTYVDNIPAITHIDGRVHTHFRSQGAVTGRMASGDPINLQNIPSRGPGKELRKLFMGQETTREVELRKDNAYILEREEEVQLQDGSWQWAELVKPGDILESGEEVVAVKVKDFKVLIGVKK